MRNFFCGWYFKCQNHRQTVAFIPAYHIRDNVKSCSLQVITHRGAWNAEYPFEEFHVDKNAVKIGGNLFSGQGCRLTLCGEGLDVRGELRFGDFLPIAYDIMGPFRYVPFLECRHSVYSMKHRVEGCLSVNGEEYVFENALGYLEGDRGRSFPKAYLWTQCCFAEGSLMLSVADIPFCGIHFTGIIGVILYRGKEYRLATYLGARAVKIRDGEAVIRQGSRTLTVRCVAEKAHPLAAPVKGEMGRRILESASCSCFYRFAENGKKVFEFVSDMASFEYEYPQ